MEVGIHNISPLLVKQLVLKLKVRVGFLERVQLFPSCFSRCRACPLDELRNSPAADNLRQGRDDRWCCAFEFLEEGDMEYIVYLHLRWKL
jgi:hypothetical protein